jgi:peroxiredoxin
MTLIEARTIAFGGHAGDVVLPGIDGKGYRLTDVRGPQGTLVAFLCNHCPYVRVIADRLVAEASALKAIGIGTIAVMPNDTESYPEDSFFHMQAFARAHGFPFPYVIDETQTLARAFGARCTPDFFGFNAQGEQQYHGRLDASRTTPVPGARRELYEAMQLIAATGRGPAKQQRSVGCSIKWRE